MRADLKRLKRETETGRHRGRDAGATPPRRRPRAAAAPAPPRREAVGRALLDRRAAGDRRASIAGVAALAVAAHAGAADARHRRARGLPQSHRRHDVRRHARRSAGVQLRQSPFLNLLPDQQVQTTLQQMGRQPTEPLTPEIGARGLSARRREGDARRHHRRCSAASYVLTLSAQNCVDGDGAGGRAGAGREQGRGDHRARPGGLRRSARSSASRSRSVQRYDAEHRAGHDPVARGAQGVQPGDDGAAHAGRLRFGAVLPPRRWSSIRSSRWRTGGSARCCRISASAPKPRRRRRAPTSSATRSASASGSTSRRATSRRSRAISRRRSRRIDCLLATYPDDYAGHSNLGSLYRDRGMLKEAIEHLEEAVTPRARISRISRAQPGLRVSGGGAFGRRAPRVRGGAEDPGVDERAQRAVHVGDADRRCRRSPMPRSQRSRGAATRSDLSSLRAQAAGYKGQMKEASRMTDDLFRRAQGSNRLQQAAEGFVGFAIAAGRGRPGRRGPRAVQARPGQQHAD